LIKINRAQALAALNYNHRCLKALRNAA